MNKWSLAIVLLVVLVQNSQSKPLELPAGNDQIGLDVLHHLKEFLTRFQGNEETRSKLNDLIETREKAMELSVDDMTDEQRKQVLEHYIKEHVSENLPPPYGTQSDDMALKQLLENYIHSQVTMGDLLMSGVRADIRMLAENFMKDGDLDSIMEFYKMAIKKYMETQGEATPKQEMLYQLVFHALQNPTDELIATMAGKSIEEASNEDKEFLGMLFMHTYKNPMVSEHVRELMKQGLMVIMQSDLAVDNPRAMTEMLLMHYIGMKMDNDKDALGALLLSLLQSQDDENSKKMAAQLVFHIVTSDDKVMDVPEDEQYKWAPPTVCKLADADGNMIDNQDCPHNYQCSVGPVSTVYNGTTYSGTLCAMPSEYLLFHSCNVEYLNGTSTYSTTCQRGECNVGPFRVQWNAEEFEANIDLNAYYCSSLVENYGEPIRLVDRTCSMIDAANFVVSQRHCPEGYTCRRGPFEIEDHPGFHGYICDDSHPYTEFITDALGSALGLTPEQMGAIALGRLSANDSEAANQQFLDYISNVLVERGPAGTVPQDPDTVGLLILKHFVEALNEQLGGAGLIGTTFEILWYKKGRYGLDDNDRQLMQLLIMGFVNDAKENAAEETEASLKEMLASHLDDHRNMMDQSNSRSAEDNNEQALDVLKLLLTHSEQLTDMGHGDNIEELLTMLLHHSEAHAQEDSDSDSNEDQSAVMRLLQMLMHHSQGSESSEEVDATEAYGVLVKALFEGRQPPERGFDWLGAGYKLLMGFGETFDEETKHALGLMIMYTRIEEILTGASIPEERMQMLLSKALGMDMAEPEPESESEEMSSEDSMNGNLIQEYLAKLIGGHDSEPEPESESESEEMDQGNMVLNYLKNLMNKDHSMRD